MSTPAHIELSPATAGVYHVPQITSESCSTASRLLQKNHDSYHMFFNTGGFHNHIAHHLLTIFALGAKPDQIQKAFDNNAGYQRPQFPVRNQVVQDMADSSKFNEFLGEEKYFHDYETFFSKEMESNGWEATLKKHMFAHNDHSETIFSRMFAGFLHPLIHLGFGVEFKQPAIIVEALAQAAVHDGWVEPYLLKAEKAAASTSSSKGLVQLIHETRANEKLRKSAHWEDGNKIRDGILVRAPEEMIGIAAQWQVKPDELERKTAEMINSTVYFAGGAQKPHKHVKFDFFYMHSVNCSIFFSAFVKEPWLTVEDKCRLLEWKGRMDLAMYASRGSPELVMDDIDNYKAKQPNDGWQEIIQRVDSYPDDGHASKLVRAIAHGEQVCKPYENEGVESFPIKGDMWLKLGHMAIDSVEAGEPRWVRNAGWDKAWEKVPDRPRL